ncbi:thioesterase domain-containing protein [Streptomyces umbrinus]|uniref:Thioesterase domain-containing protein n=1 Tax=Streptomyces umbrinus TaxID=67370 RepID=A0ABU0SMY4_9ACTN|nr:alpha/beta fold hydrolase [Streptomyces umbrinus]MDQ1024652.1 thioesterase domain-containing protein [Streptomyces umbrinus]
MTLEFASEESALTNDQVLFCIHPSGGSAHWYKALAQKLAGSCRTYGIQAAGMDPSEVPYRSIPEMANRYWEEMKRVQPTGPYRVLGWSFGGLVAHEIGQQHPDEVDAIFLLEPPTVQTGIRRRMLYYGDAYRKASEIWLEGRAANGTRRTEIETKFRRFVDSLEFMNESPGLDEWLPFGALGGIMEAAGNYMPEVSRANVTLVISDDGRSGSGESKYREGGPAQYLAFWKSLYRNDVRVVDVSGDHIDMMTRDTSIAEISRQVRMFFAGRRDQS